MDSFVKRNKVEAELAPKFTGFNVVKTTADGSCMFASIAHQLKPSVGSEAVPPSARDVRQALVSYLRACPGGSYGGIGEFLT
jgi:hypothetical protein